MKKIYKQSIATILITTLIVIIVVAPLAFAIGYPEHPIKELLIQLLTLDMGILLIILMGYIIARIINWAEF
jgi:ABC-type glycerol-3-phosphate transport system permease component